jgi:trehalose 6-phosphate synthase
LAVSLTALAAAGIQGLLEKQRLESEALTRISSVAVSSEESVLANYHARRPERIARLAERLRGRERIQDLAICAVTGPVPISSVAAYPHSEAGDRLCSDDTVARITARAALAGPDHDTSAMVSAGGHDFQYVAHYLEGPASTTLSTVPTLVLVLAHDLSPQHAHWIAVFLRTFVLTWLIGLGLLGVAMLQTHGWLKHHVKVLHHSLRSLIAGRSPTGTLDLKAIPAGPVLAPLTRDLDKLHTKILSLSQAERAPRTSAGRPDHEAAQWLSQLRELMGSRKLTVVANREPYIHQRRKMEGAAGYVGERVEVVRPASGLVTALEPILRTCGGLWIAHGSGSADADVVDESNEVAVPPSNPKYKLRRVWLSKEEESGYYYGFSNEGFWPLCHLAHNRPIFRLADWEQYKGVNRKFTDAIPDSSLTDDNVILVQDYHFAMVPKMIREKLRDRVAARAPGAKIGLFWHIPWPNAEAFGICPWNEELLRGMLGADVIGFHTQSHCNNFLEACNRYLEARIDYERFTVTMENHVTEIRAFPIGIDTAPVRFISDAEKDTLKARYGIKAQYVAVGVDRLDYTKGLIERVEGVERFLEKYPEYVGKFSLVQMGSPSRSQIPAYRLLAEQLEAAVNRVNERFGDPRYETSGGGSSDNAVAAKDVYKPIVFLAQHHEWDEIQYFYQIGDVCLVTSLHDGMNLVAKEYVWCQRPDRGALVLSKFTGAARELNDAFIINPYSNEECADAIYAALNQPAEERLRRMSSMREKVRTRSAFHWAMDLVRAVIKKQADESSVVIQLPERDRRDTSVSAKAGGA